MACGLLLARLRIADFAPQGNFLQVLTLHAFCLSALGFLGHPPRSLNTALGEGARLSHLVENVLDVARIEDGKKRYHFEECNLTELVRDAGKLMAPLARERGVEIQSRLEEVSATLDPHAIQQAVLNLLDNAVKFSPPGATVEVVLENPSADGWKIAIRDHGPGIPTEEHERIFERFHRLGNELRRETQGTGIGLSIVKHIITAHEGRVTVNSTPGEGSTFTLTAPLEPSAGS